MSIGTQPDGKKATKITLSTDALTAAKALGINIFQVCDQFLRELVRKQRKLQWQNENAEFVAAYNQLVDEEGLLLQEFRGF